MSAGERVYGLAMSVARAASPLVALGGGKLRRGIVARRDVVARWTAWAAARRDPARPLLWV
ncbi:MAG: hypothetical protein ACRELD_16505, partial [Longimicrobiales bacterium]